MDDDTPADLALTGSSSRALTQTGILLVVGGAALVLEARRRRRIEEGLVLDWISLD